MLHVWYIVPYKVRWASGCPHCGRVLPPLYLTISYCIGSCTLISDVIVYKHEVASVGAPTPHPRVEDATLLGQNMVQYGDQSVPLAYSSCSSGSHAMGDRQNSCTAQGAALG